VTERVEQRLGNYHLNRLLGTGGFADVYLGTHIYLNTRAAIKVLRGSLDVHTLEGFLIEARHLSHLVHPHIIRVFDFGIEDGTPFLVMDYAPGGNLRQQHPAGTAVSLASVVAYVSAIASALQYAHDQHLIHRDLKPENLLLGPKHEILLSDFGLALLSSTTDSLQVQPRFGTLPYMAPEQMSGRPCPASDQYALAVMVYEWLSGQRPFAPSAAELANQHLFAAPAALHERHPEIPPALERVIFKAFSHDPALRYVDVLSFATALEEASQAISPLPLLPALPAVAPLAVGAAQPVPRGSPGYVQHLPVPLTPLIGRERELQAARARLLRPAVRLLTLLGTPGVGKTRLALALGMELQQEFAHDVCFVSLAAIRDPELLVPTIIRALGLAESLDLPPYEHLVSYLREQQPLLLLDDFMHLLSAAARLADLLSACPQLKILVTSRAALHIHGEYEFVVPPLAVPDLRQLPAEAELSQVPAVALFLQCAEAINSEFKLTGDNAAPIAQICVQLGGVPLAIEMAAARSKLLSPQALLARLEHGLAVLTGGKQNVPSHQQTLRDTIAWSYDHLAPEEQRLFRRLAAFGGTFSLEASEAVVSVLDDLNTPVLDGIAALLDKSLLKQREEGGELRLYMLALVREYGLERLVACGELEQAREAHARYYLALAERAESALVGAAQAVWLEQLEREYENMQAALHWLHEGHEREMALRLATALLQFWVRGGRMSDGLSLLERGLEASDQDDSEQVSRVRAKALQAAGTLAFRLNDPEQAQRYLEASLQLSQHLEDKPGIAVSLYLLGCISYNHGEVEAGLALAQEGLSLSREVGASGLSAEILLALGVGALLPEEVHPLPAARLEPLPTPVRPGGLTVRECEVLRLLAMGLSNKQIAEQLVLSPFTVNRHTQSIYDKLGISSRSAATRFAVEHQLL
jgi:predicted ATPase/DNA-binding CsgD family transcriptional regulator